MVELQAEAYYYKIIKSKEQDISEYLPSPHMKNFAAIMERIIDKLKEDLETFKELSLEDPNNQEVKQDIINLQSKISTCQNHLNPKARGIKNNIIFATTASAKIFIAEDLKDIDSGYYKDVYDSLCFLIDNRKTSDPRKQKTLTNNKERIGIREIKNGQVRIYYQTLPNDNYYVFLITIKKADWSKRDDNKLSTRVKQIQKEYEYYSQMSQEQLEQQLEHNQPELELVIHALQKYLEVDSSKPISPIAGGSNPKVVIADKVVSSKELDEDTKLKMSSLDSRWKRVYEIAKWIYETTGSINVKLKYEIHGFQFGRWLKEQRDAYEQGKLIWEYPDDTLITLCESCHEYEHMKDVSINELLCSIKKRGVSNHEIHAFLLYIYTNLSKGNHDVIRDIIGDYWEPENDSPYIKLLAERRKEISNGTHTDDKT